MMVCDFQERIERHPDLKIVGYKDFKVYVEYKGHFSSVSTTCIEENLWTDLEDVLIGRREPECLYHMSRVVGYFSRIENWNSSKQGELKDRHKGDYNVD